MANNPSPSSTILLPLPVIENITDFVMKMHEIWNSLCGVFLLIISNMGEGKTSALHSIAQVIPTLFLDARAFASDFSEMIPCRDNKRGVLRLTEVLNEQLLNFCQSVSNPDGTLKDGVPLPIIVIDEYTMVDIKYRDRITTAIMDGVWFRTHGFKWAPLIVCLCNGRTFAPESNKALDSRELARVMQFIYIQDDGPGNFPGMRADFNDPISIQERQEYTQEVIKMFSDGSTKVPDKELPRNILGNNRSTTIFAELIEQMKAKNISEPKKLATMIGKAYFKASSQPGVMRRINYSFSALPKSVAAMHAIIATGNFPDADAADWISWAEQFRADPVAHAEARNFAKAAGCPPEAFNAIVGSMLQR